MVDARFLIGGGEHLSENAVRSPRKPSKKLYPYSVTERQHELAPQWAALDNVAKKLPETACPGGNTVISMTLHPSFLARVHYPETLLHLENLKPVGSRLIDVTPKKPRSRLGRGASSLREAEPTAQLFLAVARDRLADVAEDMLRFPEVAGIPTEIVEKDQFLRAARDYTKIESLSALGADRIKIKADEFFREGEIVPIEVIIHASSDSKDDFIRNGFVEYAQEIGLKFSIDRARVAGGLTFIPFYAPFETLNDLSQFSYLRALRRVPKLGRLTPVKRSLGPIVPFELPNVPVAHDGIKVAIFDGGLPKDHGLGAWVTARDAVGVGAPDAEALEHGVQVTSAFLFGLLSLKYAVQTPIAKVNHIRVLDDAIASDDFQLYTILERIESSLKSMSYDFVNISMGPSQAMLDDDIDPWTIMLDEIFSNGRALCTVACGNDGDLDHVEKLNRIQPPSDGVNILGVGAADSPDYPWMRAYYSCVGPGRSPGLVKPDLVAFGGTEERPFLAWAGSEGAKGTAGTRACLQSLNP